MMMNGTKSCQLKEGPCRTTNSAGILSRPEIRQLRIIDTV